MYKDATAWKKGAYHHKPAPGARARRRLSVSYDSPFLGWPVTLLIAPGRDCYACAVHYYVRLVVALKLYYSFESAIISL